MILKTCTLCAGVQKEPLFWTVAAWFDVELGRHAYKHKLCLECVATRIAPLQVHSDSNVMTCPACGIDTSTDYDAVYVTWIPKGVGSLQAECPFCSSCAARFRIWFKLGSEPLEDREPVIEGHLNAPRYSANQTLAALGINVDAAR